MAFVKFLFSNDPATNPAAAATVAGAAAATAAGATAAANPAAGATAAATNPAAAATVAGAAAATAAGATAAANPAAGATANSFDDLMERQQQQLSALLSKHREEANKLRDVLRGLKRKAAATRQEDM
eukprot:COSAG05_NODE_1436_length_4889_cov_42.859290_4_plen_127_part_00